MTMTSVVLGIAMLGTPEPPADWDCVPDCDCAKPVAGSAAAIRKGIISFIGLSFQFRLSYLAYSPAKSTTVLFMGKKIYPSTNSRMKKLFASVNICSRFSGDKVIRTLVNTPAILGKSN